MREPGDFCSDITKILGLTGWRPATTLEDGVPSTVDDDRHHRAHDG